MSYVCYYLCDKCGYKHHSDLAPEGWQTTASNYDVCWNCVRKLALARATEQPSADPEKKT